MRSRTATTVVEVVTIVGLLLVGLLAFQFLSSATRPKGVIVRGGEEAQPLEAAIAEIRPDEIATVLPRDGIPAISDPRLVKAEEAGLEDDELVIGVELAGEARAYPIRVLSAHEIVNDEIAGKPFAVTW